MRFKEEHDECQRQELSSSLCRKHPRRYPVIVESYNIKTDPCIIKNKYLIPRETTFGKMKIEFEKYMPGKNPQVSVIYFVNNKVIPINQTIDIIYRENVDVDGFLYISYTTESFFG